MKDERRANKYICESYNILFMIIYELILLVIYQ